MTRKLFVVLLTASLLLSACNLPVASGGETRAWIDAPLDGMHLLVQPYSIIFHGSDPHGISLMEVSINGAVLATLPNSQTAKTLVYLTQTWQPQGPGRYIIRVRAQNTTGAWSAQDLVTVEVAGAASPSHAYGQPNPHPFACAQSHSHPHLIVHAYSGCGRIRPTGHLNECLPVQARLPAEPRPGNHPSQSFQSSRGANCIIILPVEKHFDRHAHWLE
jgi:hypothetical protein